MATRNTQDLKKLIYDTLNNDATLQTLLGGTGRIKHGSSEQKAEYPCVIYSIIAEVDDPYNEDRPAGITRTRLAIQVFSQTSSSDQADSIEDQTYALLHGKQLSGADVLVYSCHRVSRFPVYESDSKAWRVEARYDLVNVGQ